MSSLYSPTYRPELDGLRGLGVIVVLIEHAFPGTIPGGYLAVDMFFVISGYLMATIIAKSLDQGTFTFREFYAKRILRIFPALVFVLSAVLIYGWFQLYPYELRSLTFHTTAGAFFAANWSLLDATTEYFGTNAKFLPHLHLWSLSVEEQFYTLIPLLMLLCARLRIPMIPVFILLGAASVSAFIHYHDTLPMVSFFATPVRLWQMLGGAILAQAPSIRSKKEILPAAGLILLIGSFIYFKDWSSVTGRAVSLLATLLIIAGGTGTVANRSFLSFRLLVSIGLASYSIYLWHWPLLSLTRITLGTTPSFWLKIFLLACSFLLGYLSWKFIEVPSRKSKRPLPWILAMGVLGAVSLLLYFRSDLSGRIKEPVTQLSTAPGIRDCPEAPEIRGAGEISCSLKGETPEILLVGDSHAGDKFHGLIVKDSSHSWGMLVRNSCPPVLGLRDKLNPSCQSDVEKMLRYAVSLESVHTIVFGYFGDFVRLNRTEPGSHGLSSQDNFISALRRTLRLFLSSGKKVVFLIDVPEIELYAFDCYRNENACELPQKLINTGEKGHRQMVSQLRKEFPEIHFFDPLPLFCQEEKCRFARNRIPLYRDTNHLSALGSEMYAEELLKEIKL